MSEKLEYRVRWCREEGGQVTKILQSWDAAYRKACGILALEKVKDGTGFATMAPLAMGPVIESRPVGEWTETHTQAQITESDEENMYAWAEYTRPANPASVGGDSGIF